MIRKQRKTAGVIGLGIIGSRAAAGLRAAGFQTYVWNRTPQPVPNFLPNPGDVATATDIIQIFVSDAQALFEVLQALREKLTTAHLIICSATIGPEATLEAAAFVQQTGARFLDAPFTGSKAAAEKRQLAYYVGGDDPTFLRAKPVLEATSKAVIRVGAIGDAAIVKVVTNMISAASIQALAEGLAIVRKAGLPDEVLGAALEHNACRSGVMDLKLPKMLSGNYEPHFSLKHMFKDVQLGIQIANTLELDCPVASVTAGALFSGTKQGWGDLDFASVFKVYEAAQAQQLELEGFDEELPDQATAQPAAVPGAPDNGPGATVLKSAAGESGDIEVSSSSSAASDSAEESVAGTKDTPANAEKPEDASDSARTEDSPPRKIEGKWERI